MSIKSDVPADCGASSGHCMGVAWYSVGSPPSGSSVTGRSYTTAWNEPDKAVVPDVIGNADTGTMLVAALDKRDSSAGAASVEEWEVGTSNAWGVGGYDELSQVEWIGTGGYFVYTAAGTDVPESPCDCGSTGCGTLGQLALGRMGSTGEVDTIDVPLPSGRETYYSKPESIAVAKIDTSDASCPSGATHVIYVAD